jgi:hypothetical protein
VEEHQDYLAACMDQPDFLVKVAHAYDEAGRPIELIKLFSFLLERQWASGGAPYLYVSIVENAELLGDPIMVEKNIRAFLRRFPAHPQSRPMLERLGGLIHYVLKHDLYFREYVVNQRDKETAVQAVRNAVGQAENVRKHAEANAYMTPTHKSMTVVSLELIDLGLAEKYAIPGTLCTKLIVTPAGKAMLEGRKS